MGLVRRGFTLVELLVVIAVVGLLVGLLLPALSGSRREALAVSCLNNNRSFGQAVLMYANDFNFFFPRSSHSTGSTQSSANWLKCLEPYGVASTARLCPADPARAGKLSSYATNDHMEPLTAGIDYSAITGQPLPGGRKKAHTRLTDLPRPGSTVYVAEPTGTGTADHLHSIGWTFASQVQAAIAVTRHPGTGGSSSVLFADGRAAPVPWATWRDTFSAATSPFNPLTAR
jgi:prepilin-type N-terminal cleavage/methylation domain-containing protein